MRLIANCQLSGDYGTVAAGQEFILNDHDAQKLLAAGCARKADPPRILYETKPARYEMPIIQAEVKRHETTPNDAKRHEAPGVSARDTFPGYVLVSDAQPTAVAPQSNPVLSKPNLSEPGTPDPGRRGRRKGSGAD